MYLMHKVKEKRIERKKVDTHYRIELVLSLIHSLLIELFIAVEFMFLLYYFV
jgi:hypothetical protein